MSSIRVLQFVGLTALSSGARAQSVGNVTTLLQNVLTLLQSISVLTVTIAVLWVGYKLVFQQARWADIANIVLGAAFIGGATSIAHWLLG